MKKNNEHTDLKEFLQANGWPHYGEKAVTQLLKKGSFQLSNFGSLLEAEKRIKELGYKVKFSFKMTNEDRYIAKEFLTVSI